jgi:hypothetical protein
MNKKTNIIFLFTVVAIVGTIYAFSDYSGDHSCKSLLGFTDDCLNCESDKFCSDLTSETFAFNLISKNNFALKGSTPLLSLSDTDISFFKVTLVCNAAPSIGCGSRAKPVLIGFEESEYVEEAWLNRAGTLIAVVWKEGVDVSTKKEFANAIFKEHELSVEDVVMEEYNSVSASFAKGDDWLRKNDVDELSREEASIFAKRITKTINESTELSEVNLNKIEQKIADDIYNLFINYDSLDRLGNPSSYKSILKDVIKFGNELAGKEVMPSLDTLWKSCSNISSSPRCDHTGKSCSSSCKASKS